MFAVLLQTFIFLAMRAFCFILHLFPYDVNSFLQFLRLISFCFWLSYLVAAKLCKLQASIYLADLVWFLPYCIKMAFCVSLASGLISSACYSASITLQLAPQCSWNPRGQWFNTELQWWQHPLLGPCWKPACIIK